MTGEHAEDIRYGFIGTGMMGCEHIRNVVALPGAVAVAGCDPHGPSLQDAVQAAGGALSVHTDLATMLAEEDLDAVVVVHAQHDPPRGAGAAVGAGTCTC